MTELWKLSANEIVAGYRRGDFKPSEVMEAVTDRIEAVNPGLNAVTVDLSEQAMADARSLDASYRPSAPVDTESLGLLHGVPVTIKENVDMAGYATPNGVAAFENVMATEDAPLVASLRDAGAIVVGRTNTPEFSMRATTVNPLRGRTFNPWDETASAGGSSGGAGSACAAGMGPLHHGNDIGGSLRFPSFANGVTTVKPTSYRVPVFNSSATAERGPLSATMSVQGIIGREAADVALATRVMIRADHRDPNHAPVPFDGPALPRPLTVAVARNTGGYEAHPEILALVERAADQLRDAGYQVVEVEPPPVQEAAAEWFRAGSTEMKVMLDPAIRQYGSPEINAVFDWYYEMSEILDRDGYVSALAERTRIQRDWNRFLAEHPLVLTPFLMRPTYDWDYDAQGPEQVRDLFDAAIYSTGINFLGLPAGVIGMDLVAGRPAAVQIVGQRYREDLICEALSAIEGRNGILVHQLWAGE